MSIVTTEATRHHHIQGERELDLSVGPDSVQPWGSGLNTFTRQFEALDIAFEPDGLDPQQPVDPAEDDSLALTIKVCTSEDQLATEIGGSFEAGAAYAGAKLTGSLSLLSNSEFTATSSVVLVQTTVCKSKQMLDPAKLKLSESALARLSDPAKFVSQYGNYFQSARLTGGTLTVVMHFSSGDLATKQALDSELNAAAAGVGSLDAKIKTLSTNKHDQTSLEITIYQIGGGTPPQKAQGSGVGLDPDALVNYALGFAGTITGIGATYGAQYNDFGSIADAVVLRDALAPAEATLDAITDVLEDYREPLSGCNYALDHKADIGFDDAEVTRLESMQRDLEDDIQALQDYLTTASSFRVLEDPAKLVPKTIKQLPAGYSDELAAIDLDRRTHVLLGSEVFLHLKSESVYVSAMEPYPSGYYAKLGHNPVRLKLVHAGGKTGPLQDRDPVFIETTETVAVGYLNQMQELGGTYGDYVGFGLEPLGGQSDLRFTIVKCTPGDENVNYGDPIWIQTEDRLRCLEDSGVSYRDYLGLQPVEPKPKQYWTIENPGSAV